MGSALVLAGRYRLEERIAAGGVGEVWRGRDTVLARAVAVKLLRPEYAQHRETLARFRAEARHAAGITHPGIAQVYDYMAPRLFELRCVLKPTGDKPVLDHPLAAEGQPGLVAAGGRAPRSHAFFAEL